MDESDLGQLVHDLSAAGAPIVINAHSVVSRGALTITEDARSRVEGLRHAPFYPRAITYDVTIEPGALVAEIGPDKDRTQGALGNLLEYGSVKNDPIPHLGPALDAEVPQFTERLGELLGRQL